MMMPATISASEPIIAVRFAGSISRAKPVLGVPTPSVLPPVFVPPPDVSSAQVLDEEYAPLLYEPQEYAAASADGAGSATDAPKPTSAALSASIRHLPLKILATTWPISSLPLVFIRNIAYI